MKILVTLTFLLYFFGSFAQQEKFLLQGRVIDQAGKAVSDVYIVNLNTHEKDISHTSGIFAIWVLPDDSLVFSHIAYYRRVVTVNSILLDPDVTIVSEHVNIPEVIVNPEQKTEMENAKANLEFLNDFKAPGFVKIDSNDNDPVSATMRENNSVLRSEASSISIIRFSPSVVLSTLINNKQKRDRRLDYKSTRKVVEPPKEKGND